MSTFNDIKSIIVDSVKNAVCFSFYEDIHGINKDVEQIRSSMNQEDYILVSYSQDKMNMSSDFKQTAADYKNSFIKYKIEHDISF